jgi:tetratricopeptide (TPR) repeat protein
MGKMPKRIFRTFLVLSLLCLQAAPGYALEWKALHEKAEKTALTDALASVVREPRSLETLYTLGLVYIDLYKIDDAEGVFRDMLRIDAQSIEGQWGAAEVLRRRHKRQEARPILDRIIKAAPAFAPAYISLGYMLFDDKEYDRSIALALHVLKQGRSKVDLTNYVRAFLIIGGAKGMIADRGGPFSKLINGTQILPNMKKAERLQPDSAGVAFGLGSFYLLAPSFVGGDKTKAIAYLEKSVKLDPNFTDAYARLAQAYKMKKDMVKYDFYLGKALELDSQNELALTVKGRSS